MNPPLDGVKVVEVAMWGFVPATGVVLADWGAKVIKIEHPVHGDPMRGLVRGQPRAAGTRVNFMWEIFNRGKRSVGVDLRPAEGLELLYRLVDDADVFLTSFLPEARSALRIDAETIRARNPRIIYGCGSGLGQHGPEADRGGYDLAAWWCRAGVAAKTTPTGADIPAAMPSAAFGDVTSGTTLAGGIAAALVRQQRTGEGGLVDVSLLHAGMWSMAAEITATNLLGIDAFYTGDRSVVNNPLAAPYRTKDGRFIQLVMLEADRHWPDLCRRIDRPDLLADPRFADIPSRRAHAAACVAELEAAFGDRTLDQWRDALADATGVWAVAQTPRELADDPQVQANGYLRTLETLDGHPYPAVPSPVLEGGCSFRDGDVPPAPELGQHTEEVLLECGYSWDRILELKDNGTIT